MTKSLQLLKGVFHKLSNVLVQPVFLSGERLRFSDVLPCHKIIII